MATWFDNLFGFSSRQLKALVGIVVLSVLAIIYLVISDYTDKTRAGRGLTIYIGDSDQRYTPLFTVDLNYTPADSLELIPGIGPVFSGRIVAYRDSVGGFTSIEEITKIRGISHKLFTKIQSYLSVSPLGGQ